jgi:hypothetical protein
VVGVDDDAGREGDGVDELQRAARDAAEAISPSIIGAFQMAVASVRDTTYVGMRFILSAKPSWSVMDGQAAAKPM